jgi:peroxiredoxin
MKWLKTKTVAAMAGGVLLVGSGTLVVQQLTRIPSAMAAAKPAGEGVSGIVRSPDGKPVPGAKVYVSSATTPVPIYSKPSPEVLSALSGTEGQFSFPSDHDQRAVIVISEKGYGEATVTALSSHPELTLQPWARVEGTLRQGTERLANQTIHLSRTRFGSKIEQQTFRTVHDTTTKTDGDGNYVFARVAPGDTWISWRADRGGYDVQYRYFDVQPGQTLTAEIGGRGRAVIGRAVLAGSNGPVKFYGSIWPRTPHQMRRPPNWSELPPEEQAALTVEYEKSPGAKLYNQERCPIDFRLTEDGAFTVPDLPAGQYRITVASWTGAPVKSRIISRGTAEVTVPEMPTGRSDEPLDVGEISAFYVAPFRPGEAAPDFAGRTLEDRPLKFSDYRGKFVLLHFWRGDDAKSLVDAEYLKAAQKAWGKDARFVLLGLNFDHNGETAKAHVAKNGLAWTHCFFGENSDMPARYRIRKPTAMLISADGRILQPELAGADITAALEDALGTK